MHLSSLNLTNFRSFSNEEIFFEPRLTVLTGENNGGKSNIIDAIRLATTPLGGRREIYCERTDIRFDATKQLFEIAAIFDELSPPQQGRLLSTTIDDSLIKARLGLTYDATNSQSLVKPSYWGGRFKAPPEIGCHEAIRHVYLPPLRDAKRALASGNPTRIHALLNHFLGDRDPDEVAKSLARSSTNAILTEIDEAIAIGLEVLTAGVRKQGAALGFSSEEKLIDIARDLQFKLADHGITPEDLQYSGHGFANLLYMATIAVELERADDADLTIFLVEEPEAHLHPQLQAAVLNFLEERADASIKLKQDTNAPAGNLQVIVATHSPNLSAWVENKNLVYVRSLPGDTVISAPNSVQSADVEVARTRGEDEANTVSRPVSRCIPLSRLNLTEPERRKLDRYLDVTKSALLFGGRVLLVEGIAEALLLPVIAKHHVLKDHADKFRVFRSAVFVPIGGVDFEPYVKALLSPYRGVRIADRVVVVTDGDKTVNDSKVSPGQKRKVDLDKLAASYSASSLLHVFPSSYSLESELVESGNLGCMKSVYLALHPRSEEKWTTAVSKAGAERANAIQALFQNTPKGDFAQLLAEQVVKEPGFNVPTYIHQSIEALVQ